MRTTVQLRAWQPKMICWGIRHNFPCCWSKQIYEIYLKYIKLQCMLQRGTVNSQSACRKRSQKRLMWWCKRFLLLLCPSSCLLLLCPSSCTLPIKTNLAQIPAPSWAPAFSRLPTSIHASWCISASHFDSSPAFIQNYSRIELLEFYTCLHLSVSIL